MHKLLPLLLLLCSSLAGWAQGNIPIGSWRTHFSYAQVQEVALAGNRVYAASEWGFFYFDKTSNETVELGPLKGFSDVGVSSLGWQEQKKLLFVGYRSGNIDLLQNGKVINIPAIRNASRAGSKAIQAVTFRGDSAILATDYGISIVNLPQARLLDSYLNLGPAGELVQVHDVAVLHDTLYAATSKGLIANRLSAGVNLNDFRSWRRLGTTQGLPESARLYLEVVGQQLWVATERGPLYRKMGNVWVATAFTNPGGEEVRDLQKSELGDALIITTSTGITRYLIGEDAYNTTNYELVKSPLTAVQDKAGTFWIGDGLDGLLTNLGGAISARNPDGPISDQITALQYANEQVVALNGGADAFGNPLGTRGFSVFSADKGWVSYHPQKRAGSKLMPNVQDLAAAAYAPTYNSWYFASYSDGLLAWQPKEGQFTLYGLNTPGTSLVEASSYPDKVLLSTVAVDGEGSVWMGSDNSERPLHRFKPADGSWQHFLAGSYFNFQQIIIPYTNDIWMRFRPNSFPKSVLVFNPAKAVKSRYLDSQTGTGGLVSDKVYVLQEDLEGSIWLGTNDGLSYIVNPAQVLTNSPVDAVLPVYQLRPLLNESLVTALAVDGGNRKWIGTTNGIWLFGDEGDTLYHHFTTANSPLPSNIIKAVTVHQQTGEVFIATDKGLVSYRSGATAGGSTHASSIKVFPNPVRPGYRGQVGITGLVQDAVVKITDAAGFLVRELPAEGGTAAWDLRDSRGTPVASGVYLIFSANELGTEAMVGKVAVVR